MSIGVSVDYIPSIKPCLNLSCSHIRISLLKSFTLGIGQDAQHAHIQSLQFACINATAPFSAGLEGARCLLGLLPKIPVSRTPL